MVLRWPSLSPRQCRLFGALARSSVCRFVAMHQKKVQVQAQKWHLINAKLISIGRSAAIQKCLRSWNLKEKLVYRCLQNNIDIVTHLLWLETDGAAHPWCPQQRLFEDCGLWISSIARCCNAIFTCAAKARVYATNQYCTTFSTICEHTFLTKSQLPKKNLVCQRLRMHASNMATFGQEVLRDGGREWSCRGSNGLHPMSIRFHIKRHQDA